MITRALDASPALLQMVVCVQRMSSVRTSFITHPINVIRGFQIFKQFRMPPVGLLAVYMFLIKSLPVSRVKRLD